MSEPLSLRIVKLDDHQEWTINIDTDATIERLIKLVSESTGIERNQFRLVFRGRIISNLPPEHLIHQCGISSADNSIVLVQRRARQICTETVNRPSTRSQGNDEQREQPAFEEIAPNVYRIRRFVDGVGPRGGAESEGANGSLTEAARDLLHGVLVSHDGESSRTIPITGSTITTTIRGRLPERGGDPSNPMMALATLLTSLYSDDSPNDAPGESYNAVINFTTNSSASPAPEDHMANPSTQQGDQLTEQSVPSESAADASAAAVSASGAEQRQVVPSGGGGSTARNHTTATLHGPVTLGFSASPNRSAPQQYRGHALSGISGGMLDPSSLNQLFFGSIPARHGPSREPMRCLCNSTQTERVVLPFGSNTNQPGYNSNVSSVAEPHAVRRNKIKGDNTISRARQCLQRARNVRYLHTDELQALLSDLSDMTSMISTDINIFMQKLTSLNRRPSANARSQEKRTRAGTTAKPASSIFTHKPGAPNTASSASSSGFPITQSLVVPHHGHDQLHGSTTNYFSDGIRKRVFNLIGMLLHLNAAIPHCIDALRNSLSNSMLQIAAHRSGISSDNPIKDFGSSDLFIEFVSRITNAEFEERNLIVTDSEDDATSYDWDTPSYDASFPTLD